MLVTSAPSSAMGSAPLTLEMAHWAPTNLYFNTRMQPWPLALGTETNQSEGPISCISNTRHFPAVDSEPGVWDPASSQALSFVWHRGPLMGT